MKKMMILTLAVLGMVLGSFAVVQPAKAAVDCDHFSNDYGCSYAYAETVLLGSAQEVLRILNAPPNNSRV